MTRIFVFLLVSWVFVISFDYASSHHPSFPDVLPVPSVSSKPVSSAVSTDDSDVMLMTMPAVIATM